MKSIFYKRLFDIFFSSFLIIFFLPVIIVTSTLVFIKLGSPIFFIQTRCGLDGKPFLLFKFRSMTFCRDENNGLFADSLRLVPFGVFLRSTSLDELPSLWNVLKGDMSLVGPRPLLMEYLPLYSAEQARRHEVFPGITGWAQVNGRNSLSWDEKFQLDLFYVDNSSMWLDIKILFMTVRKVLMRDGIAAEGEATMPRFRGNKNSEGLGS
jgi:lipopolysaccharide/colanic/teichoic acid biosynthesis glycosyltransferase